MPRIGALKVSRALIARLLFALHSLVAIWILYAESKRTLYWAFAASPILLFIEAAFTIILRHGDEYKWFCPSVFIFLCGSVPPIWLLELRSTWRAVHNATHSTSTDSSANLKVDLKWVGYIMVELPQLPMQMWLQVVEQSLLVILILGRWLLPKGRITRDELSQLLLAYLAISADIIELFNLFQETKVRMDIKLSLMVLIFWSISLVQFPIVITTVKGQKVRHCFSPGNDCNDTTALPPFPPEEQKEKIMSLKRSGSISSSLEEGRRVEKATFCKSFRNKALDLRIWGTLSTILLQDLPFWLLRMYLICWEKVMSYTMFFFLCKNALIMFIQIYRIIIICTEKDAKKKRKQEEASVQISQTRIPRPKSLYPFINDQPIKADLKEKHSEGQNGSVKQMHPTESSVPRPSFLITGTVDAHDLMEQAKQRRNAITTAKPFKRLQKLLPKRRHQSTVVAVDDHLPQIRLASPDEDTMDGLDAAIH